jgi:hypothetical protein
MVVKWYMNVVQCVAELHHFYAAPGKNFNSALDPTPPFLKLTIANNNQVLGL